MQVTVTLSDDVYERAKRFAELSGNELAEALAQALNSMLPPLETGVDNRPIGQLSDDDVLKTADSMMDDVLANRMSSLLYK